jgi:peptidyl-dipeptidase Dcp
VYHPDVKAYEVYDAQERFLAVLYLDFFPREGKSGGAWMTSYRSQEKVNGMDVRPLISVVCNFSKPTPTRPSLLTFNEFNTFLHEFGHALHGIFSDVTYPGLSGTSVYRDFVELPSQIMENWALERGFLDMFARHYETGEGIPGELVDRIIASKNYNAAYAMVRQLSFALADMGWHSITRPLEEPVDVFEARAMEPAQLFPRLENSMMGTYFEHIFAGGYAAGYYSYKWAEVLDADAYQVSVKTGFSIRPQQRPFAAISFRKAVASTLWYSINASAAASRPLTPCWKETGSSDKKSLILGCPTGMWGSFFLFNPPCKIKPCFP